MRGLTHRKLTIIRLAGYHTGWSAWHFHHINFPESLAMGLAPMLGEIPGSGQPNRHTPRLAGAVQEWRRGHSLPPGTPHRWQKPVSTGLRTRCPHSSITPPRIGGRASPRPLPAAGSSSGPSSVPSGATPAPAVRQPHLPNDSELLHCGERFCSYWNVRRCWEALPLTREGS